MKKHNERNAYYNVDFSQILEQLCVQFVTWTKVLSEEFNDSMDKTD